MIFFLDFLFLISFMPYLLAYYFIVLIATERVVTIFRNSGILFIVLSLVRNYREPEFPLYNF